MNQTQRDKTGTSTDTASESSPDDFATNTPSPCPVAGSDDKPNDSRNNDNGPLTLIELEKTVAQQAAAVELLIEAVQHMQHQITDATAATIDDRVSLLEDRFAEQLNAVTNQLHNTATQLPPETIRELDADVRDILSTSAENDTASNENVGAENEAESESSDSSESSWEAIRNAFLDDEEPKPSPSEQLSETQTFGPEVEDEIEQHLLPEFELPETLDPAQLSETELRDEFLHRETLLRTLVGRLRHSKTRVPSISLDELQSHADQLPGEMTQRIESNLAIIDEQLRLGELELSLERARVARQLSQLQTTRQQLESNARQMGLTIDEDGVIQADPNNTQQSSKSGRKWLGAMGFGS